MSEETNETHSTEHKVEPANTAETAAPTEAPKKKRAKRGANTELKYAVTVSSEGSDYIFVPTQAEHESVTAARDALKEYAANNDQEIQDFYNSIVDLLPTHNSEEMTLHFSIVRYLNKYLVKTETVQTTVLTELK